MLRIPGKLILFGEYAVLEGHPALVCAVDRFVEARYAEAHHLRVEAPTIGTYEPTSARYELPFIEAAAEGLSAPTGIFVIDSTAFHGSDGKLGLGSSAAATVAFLKAVNRQMNSNWSASEIFRRAQNAHRKVQGTGSGADIAASTFGGTLAYAWKPDERATPGAIRVGTDDGDAQIQPVSGPIETISAVWSGQSASTPQLVKKVHDLREHTPAVYQGCIADLADASTSGIRAWEAGNRPGLMSSARSSIAALRRLGQTAGVELMTETHQTLNEYVGDRGVVKPTGAGGGDLAWLIGRSPAEETQLRSELSARGYHCYLFKICPSDNTGPS